MTRLKFLILAVLMGFCSFGSAQTPLKLGKGHLVFDVRNARKHLLDVHYWRNNGWGSVTDPKLASADGTTATVKELVTFVKNDSAAWLGVKCCMGKKAIAQFDKELVDACAAENLPLIGWHTLVDPTVHAPSDQAAAITAAIKLAGLKHVIIMPSDKFYENGTVQLAQQYLAAFNVADAPTFIYAPEISDHATAGASAKAKNRDDIHQEFYKHGKCAAIMPRAFWKKAGNPNDKLKKDKEFAKSLAKNWAKGAAAYTGRRKGLSLILQGQVQQEYCDDEKKKNNDCTGFPEYGLVRAPSSASGIQTFVSEIVNSKPLGKKRYRVGGLTIWDFEDFNPQEHIEFKAAAVTIDN